MHIPGQRQHGQPHPAIDIIGDRRRLNRTITLGPVRKGTTTVEASFASNSSQKAATQLEVFLGLLWSNRPAEEVIRIVFRDVDQQAEYTLPEAPDVNLTGFHPIRMTVTRGLAGPSTMSEDGHFVLILSDVMLVLTVKSRMGTEKTIKLGARHFTLKADGVITVHT